MSTKENKALARLWFAEGWNKGNVTVADVIFSPHFTPNGIEVGIEGPKKMWHAHAEDFPISPLLWKTSLPVENSLENRWYNDRMTSRADLLQDILYNRKGNDLGYTMYPSRPHTTSFTQREWL